MALVQRITRRLGCLGTLVLAVVFVVAFYAVVAPWSFRIGDRSTPFGTWSGVGKLRDSTGAQYGLYVHFYPYFRGGTTRLGRMPWPHYSLRGTAWACTARGAKYRFDLRGAIFGAWLNTNGKQLDLSLRERRGPKIPRAFRLYGAFNGQELVMDDRKTMFMNFRSDGTLTPSGSYTSPVPEKYANVTLQWGSENDFESLCTNLVGRLP